MPLLVQALLAALYGLTIAAMGILVLVKGVPAGIRRYREGGFTDHVFGSTVVLGSGLFGLFAIAAAINFLLHLW